MKLKHIYALAVMALPLASTAQIITFEDEAHDFKQLGIYDTWEASPFRTGVLKGNYAVIDNHLTTVEDDLGIAPNDSKKILAVQRSRFGSNTFGVRVDLNETFELTPQTQYLHVMVNRPYSGRVMVVGLGKRQDRAGQSPETEQFWAMSTTNIGAGKWQDVVLPFKGNGGIDIYSLVIVPDCESPHHYTTDEVCYIDNIVVNNDPTSRITYGYYPINFDKEQRYTRNDRRLKAFSLESPSDGIQIIEISAASNTVYEDLTTMEFLARAGETVTPMFDYPGGWMHGYVFLDRNNDGKFSPAVNADLTMAEDSEVMAFSFYGAENNDSGKNSAGDVLTGGARNVLNPPAFKIPENLANGYYRLRYKVDWNSVAPGGNMDSANPILGNGGSIVDVMLNVHGDYCNVNDANRNGEVLAADGSKLVKYQAEFGKPFTIRMNPENGFEHEGIIVKHGYNLSGDSIVHDNVQWQSTRFSRKLFNDKHEFTIPAECMNGDIEIEGLFIEKGTYVPER